MNPKEADSRRFSSARIALIALVIAGLAPGTWIKAELPREKIGAPIRATAVSVPGPGEGSLQTVALWRLDSLDPRFGGYSALVAHEGGLIAGSDAGTFLRLRFSRRGTIRARIEELDRPLVSDKRDYDLESLAHDPNSGRLWGGFEMTNAIARFSPDLRVEARLRPAAMRHWRRNAGPEAMTRLGDGRFVVIAERGEGSEGRLHRALWFDGDPTDPRHRPTGFAVRAPRGLRPVDVASLPDGRWLVLLRDFRLGLPPSFESALAIADPHKIARGAVLDLGAPVRLAPLIPRENYEGLAVVPTDDGSCNIYLISDDNFSAFQRTMLAQLKWRACKKARSERGAP